MTTQIVGADGFDGRPKELTKETAAEPTAATDTTRKPPTQSFNRGLMSSWSPRPTASPKRPGPGLQTCLLPTVSTAVVRGTCDQDTERFSMRADIEESELCRTDVSGTVCTAIRSTESGDKRPTDRVIGVGNRRGRVPATSTPHACED